MNDQLKNLIRDEEPSLPNTWGRLLPLALPAGILAGFVVVSLLLFGDRILPATEVTTENVITVQTLDSDVRPEVNQQSTTTADAGNQALLGAAMKFQATGWIEADPYPIKVSALTDGVIATVEVLEGESVQAGQTLATLIDEDAQLNLATAESKLANARAAAASHHGMVAMADAKVEAVKLQGAEARSRLMELQDRANRLGNMGADVASEEEVVQAKLKVETQKAAAEALTASLKEAQADLERHQQMHAEFEAEIKEAETEVARSNLALQRTRIVSPIDAIVQRLLVVPGHKRMLAMDDPDSAVVAILYQPDKLQVRVDVPLADAAGLFVGQAVRLKTSFLPAQVFAGEVTRIVGEADLQRNTLQAKVRIVDPHPSMRPDMLCRAEFLEIPFSSSEIQSQQQTAPSHQPGTTRVGYYLPQSAIVESDDNEPGVWVLDESGQRLVFRVLQLGNKQRDGYISATDGVLPGEQVVVDPVPSLDENMRVRPHNREDS